jgi:hypothetical protein
MAVHSRLHVTLRRLLVVFFIDLAVARSVDAELIDNFNDGNDTGWSYIDNTTSSPWGPAEFDASSGGYTLATSGDVSANPPGVSDSLFAEWTSSAAPQFSNGFLRAKVRPNTEGTSFFLVLRRTGGSGYALGGATSQNDFYITRVDNGVTIPLASATPLSGIVAGQDWILEAGAVGSQISLKYWPDGETPPAIPQLTVSDSMYSSGPFLVGARRDNAFQAAGRVSVTFDDIVFRVPEPATWILLLATWACFLFSARSERKQPCC